MYIFYMYLWFDHETDWQCFQGKNNYDNVDNAKGFDINNTLQTVEADFEFSSDKPFSLKTKHHSDFHDCFTAKFERLYLA